jgi:hypothetical protein
MSSEDVVDLGRVRRSQPGSIGPIIAVFSLLKSRSSYPYKL